MLYIFSLFCALLLPYAYGLDATDVKLIDSYKIVSSKVSEIRLHEDGGWKVDPDKMDQDSYEYGNNEFKDLTDWKHIKQENWFDLGKWKETRKLKDTNPNWRTYLRNKRNSEITARVIKCIGVCRYFQETRGIRTEYMSVLREGDEFITTPHSYAWLTLIDGTLIRVAPESSLTFIEVNLTKQKTFHLIRLNFGQIQTQSRLPGEFEPMNKPETDLAFYPLMIQEANREYYARKEFQQYKQFEQMIYSITENAGYTHQYVRLNEMNKENSEYMKNIDSHLMIFTPNVTMNLINSHANIFYSVNSKTHLKITEDIPGFKKKEGINQSHEVSLRGYNNRDKKELPVGEWFEVNQKGSEIYGGEKLEKTYAVTEGFLRRIPTIQLAREIFFNKYTKSLFNSSLGKNELAKDFRYYLWEGKEQLPKRLKFLDEYIRRIETTNVKVIAKVFKDHKPKVFTKVYYQEAMKKHYFALRQQYSEKMLAVRELNDNEYYLWLIKNAK